MAIREKCILVVGETRTENGIRVLALENAGYIVLSALNVASVLETMRDNLFDMVVVDGRLPPADLKLLLETLHSLGIHSVLVGAQKVPQSLRSLAAACLSPDDILTLVETVAAMLKTPRG